MPSMRTAPLFIGLLGVIAAVSATPCPQLPVGDLGYERHQALSHDEATDTYLFQNIRYAQSPTGDLRFRAPVSPPENRTTIQTGSELRVCPQGIPGWQAKASGAAAKFANPKEPISVDLWVEDIRNAQVPDVDFNAGTSEDCLRCARSALCIHGGGGVLGGKSGYPQQYMVPSGILSHASTSPEGLIFVAINYRLGAFGYLDSPDVRADGNANVANLDQRFALNWVQDNIHLFGGDRNRVTAMGESGGGGSIILQMAADSEEFGPTPFSKAIIQSPAYIPTAKSSTTAYDDFLGYTGVESLKEARAVDSKTVIAANAAQIGNAPPTTYIFGNAIDSSFLHSSPMEILRNGRFNKSVAVLAGHNSWEGYFFFDPNVSNDEQFGDWVQASVAGLSSEQVDELVNEVYPATFDGTYGYTSQETRQMSLWEEAFFDCNFQLLGNAIGGKSYAYEFSVPPGFHTQDLRYTFNAPGASVPFPKAQHELQSAIVSFAQNDVPTTADGKDFPPWEGLVTW
ncbi:alpha/beta-hydrolase [Sarocladium strictum]